jgi:hypothetical protein
LPARTQRLVLTFGAVATTVLIALLALNLVDIERQRRIAARQEQRAKSLAGQADAGLGDVRAGLEHGLPPVRAGLRRADRLVRSLLGHGGPAAIEAAGELARDLTAGHRASALVDRGNDLLAALQRSDAVADVDLLPRLTVQLLAVTRELAALGRDTSLDADVLRAQTIDFKRKSLALQRETLVVLRRSLAIQEETLVHVRNLDRRTGGAIPPPTR